MDKARNLPSKFEGSGATDDAEMEALSDALQSNSVPLMVVACQELRNQFIHHPESATLHFLRQGQTDKSMLQALCCCISSGDETCYREASIVLKLFVLEGGDHAAFAIAEESSLLHALCRLATQKEVVECTELLVSMGKNRRVLWLVSNLTKIIRVHIMHESHIIKDAFERLHENVLDKHQDKLQVWSPTTRSPTKPTRVCDVDDFLVQQALPHIGLGSSTSTSSLVERDRSILSDSSPTFEALRGAVGAQPRVVPHTLYGSWTEGSPQREISHARDRPQRSYHGTYQSWDGADSLREGVMRFQPISMFKAKEPRYPTHVDHHFHSESDAMTKIIEAQQLLRYHMTNDRRSQADQRVMDVSDLPLAGMHHRDTRVYDYDDAHFPQYVVSDVDPCISLHQVTGHVGRGAQGVHQGVHQGAHQGAPASQPSRIVTDVPLEWLDQNSRGWDFENHDPVAVLHSVIGAPQHAQHQVLNSNLPRDFPRFHDQHVGPHLDYNRDVPQGQQSANHPQRWDMMYCHDSYDFSRHHLHGHVQSRHCKPGEGRAVYLPGVSPSEYMRRSHLGLQSQPKASMPLDASVVQVQHRDARELTSHSSGMEAVSSKDRFEVEPSSRSLGGARVQSLASSSDEDDDEWV